MEKAAVEVESTKAKPLVCCPLEGAFLSQSLRADAAALIPTAETAFFLRPCLEI
jgi:hypothetical protein